MYKHRAAAAALGRPAQTIRADRHLCLGLLGRPAGMLGPEREPGGRNLH